MSLKRRKLSNSNAAKWRLLNPHRWHTIQLQWYYTNRERINLMFSKPKGPEEDIAEEWLAEKYNL